MKPDFPVIARALSRLNFTPPGLVPINRKMLEQPQLTRFAFIVPCSSVNVK